MTEIGLADKVVRIHRAMTRAKIPHAYGGALALAYYATPRATMDIDLNVFVAPEHHGPTLKVLTRLGIERIPPIDEIIERGQARTWWGPNPVDLFFAYDPIHDEMRAWSRTVPFGDTQIPIIAGEHLLVAKAVFDRTKDWIDIEQMLIAMDSLDVEEVRRWLDHLVGKDDGRYRRVDELIVRLCEEPTHPYSRLKPT